MHYSSPKTYYFTEGYIVSRYCYITKKRQYQKTLYKDIKQIHLYKYSDFFQNRDHICRKYMILDYENEKLLNIMML